MRFATTFKANPLFPSSSTMDFVLCFRYSEAAATDDPKITKSTAEKRLASVGVISATVMSLSATLDTNTKMYFAPVAGFYEDNSKYNDGKVVLPLLRATGNFNTADLVSGGSLSIFLD